MFTNMRKATLEEIGTHFPKHNPSEQWRIRIKKKGLDPDEEIKKFTQPVNVAVIEELGKKTFINIDNIKQSQGVLKAKGEDTKEIDKIIKDFNKL